MNHLPELKTLLARLQPPQPPAFLRDRTLHVAQTTLEQTTAQNRWARIYASRTLRAVWVVAVVVLVVANLIAPEVRRSWQKQWSSQDAAWQLPELREAVAVPRLREAYVSLDARPTMEQTR